MKRLDPDLDVHPFVGGNVPYVQVSATKGGNPYLMPLTADGKAAFMLFVRVGAHGTFSTQAFRKSWLLACEQAHVPHFNPYKLRHSFATRLRRTGADLADVQALFGHKSPKTTARYADVSREKIVAAVQRIDRAWTGSSSARSQAAQSHAYLRGPEQDVLREYEKYAKEPNVASELPTVTDKTTVGLLIAEWHRRMDKRVAFLSLTNQLAGQVLEEGQRLNVPCADLRGTKDKRSAAEEGRFRMRSAIDVSTY